MPNAHQSWEVLPHNPIEKLAENLWRVQGALPKMALRRVMTIARLGDGRLVIHSAIALDDASMQDMEAWGTPAVLIVPNVYHRLDAMPYKKRFPDLCVLCPEGARNKVEEILPVDGTYEDFPSDDAVTLSYIDGVAQAEGVLQVRSQDGTTLVFNDLLFNMPHAKGVAGFIFRYLTQSTGGPRFSRIVRWFVIKDKAAARAAIERLADTPDLVRIVVSHHRMITDDPAGVLQQAASRL